MRNSIGGCLVLLAACVLFGILAADPQPGFPDGSSGASTVAVSSKILQVRPGPEVVLYNLINQERGKSGLKALHWDAKLAEAAEDFSSVLRRARSAGAPHAPLRSTGHRKRKCGLR
jgi:hypothetical protein